VVIATRNIEEYGSVAADSKKSIKITASDFAKS